MGAPRWSGVRLEFVLSLSSALTQIMVLPPATGRPGPAAWAAQPLRRQVLGIISEVDETVRGLGIASNCCISSLYVMPRSSQCAYMSCGRNVDVPSESCGVE
jgi:hypothetical protein